jgi:ATP-dependent protease ClpP protease subunit
MRVFPFFILSSIYAFTPKFNSYSRRAVLLKTPVMTSFISSEYKNIHNDNQNKNDNDNENESKSKNKLTNSITTAQFNIRLVGEITEENCAQLGDVLINCDNAAKKMYETENITNSIYLHITSSGGALMPTLYICDLIQYLDTDVITFVDGYAASAASLITVCGNERYITKHSSMLIHQLSADISGKFVEIKDKFNNAEQLMNSVADIYLSNTNITQEKLVYLLQHDIWLNSTMCLKLGLVDKII